MSVSAYHKRKRLAANTETTKIGLPFHIPTNSKLYTKLVLLHAKKKKGLACKKITRNIFHKREVLVSSFIILLLYLFVYAIML